MISDRLGNDIEAFNEKYAALHGIPLDMADAAYRFDIKKHIPEAVLYWAEDEEFQPEVNLMFDRTIREQLPLDIVFTLAVEICSRLSGDG